MLPTGCLTGGWALSMAVQQPAASSSLAYTMQATASGASGAASHSGNELDTDAEVLGSMAGCQEGGGS